MTSKGSDDFLEEEVKPKASQIADAPKPPGKKRQPVKISIPTIDSVRMLNQKLLCLPVSQKAIHKNLRKI